MYLEILRFRKHKKSNSGRNCPKKSNIKVPLLAPAGMFILADEDIPDEGMKIAEKIGSIEEWKENYNPYNGDKLGWGNI